MSSVVIKDCAEYDLGLLKKQMCEGINLLGGWRRFVSPGMKVLLKINLIGPKSSGTAAVTHFKFVRALTQLLKEQGCTVWIGDSSGGAIAGIAPTARSFEVSGLAKVAREEGAEIKNFDKEGVAAINPPSGLVDVMHLAKPMFEADLVINLPKLKTHSAAIYTGAIKNLFGCIPGLKKAEYHRLAPNPTDFGEIIADIHSSVNVGLHIMDGVIAMQGEGPTAGEVYPAQKILLSTDPLALDTIAIDMLGMEIEDIPILTVARNRMIGQSDLSSIKVIGDYNTPPKLAQFKYPKRFRSTKQRNYKALVKVIDFLKTRPKISKKLCKNCNMCVESCPVQAIQDDKSIDYSVCIECMCCHELCMHHAVVLKKDNFIADILTRFYRGRYR